MYYRWSFTLLLFFGLLFFWNFIAIFVNLSRRSPSLLFRSIWFLDFLGLWFCGRSTSRFFLHRFLRWFFRAWSSSWPFYNSFSLLFLIRRFIRLWLLLFRFRSRKHVKFRTKITAGIGEKNPLVILVSG